MKNSYIYWALLFVLLYPSLLFAQSEKPNNTAVSEKKAVDFFYTTINENAGIYKGTEYIMYDQRIKGTPYFMESPPQPSDIFYDGTLYKNVSLFYETTSGSVIIREFGQGVFISLINEKVGYFTLLNHTFVHLIPDSTNKIITDDYYDRLYNGATGVYVKRQKLVYEDPRTFEKSFIEDNHYYIYKNYTFYQVVGKGAVLSVLKDKKKEIVKYMHQNDINFKRDPETAMVKMAEYYDKLTH